MNNISRTTSSLSLSLSLCVSRRRLSGAIHARYRGTKWCSTPSSLSVSKLHLHSILFLFSFDVRSDWSTFVALCTICDLSSDRIFSRFCQRNFTHATTTTTPTTTTTTVRPTDNHHNTFCEKTTTGYKKYKLGRNWQTYLGAKKIESFDHAVKLREKMCAQRPDFVRGEQTPSTVQTKCRHAGVAMLVPNPTPTSMSVICQCGCQTLQPKQSPSLFCLCMHGFRFRFCLPFAFATFFSHFSFFFDVFFFLLYFFFTLLTGTGGFAF